MGGPRTPAGLLFTAKTRPFLSRLHTPDRLPSSSWRAAHRVGLVVRLDIVVLILHNSVQMLQLLDLTSITPRAISSQAHPAPASPAPTPPPQAPPPSSSLGSLSISGFQNSGTTLPPNFYLFPSIPIAPISTYTVPHVHPEFFPRNAHSILHPVVKPARSPRTPAPRVSACFPSATSTHQQVFWRFEKRTDFDVSHELLGNTRSGRTLPPFAWTQPIVLHPSADPTSSKRGASVMCALRPLRSLS
ncbi:hypothetical protein BV25DRAFT_1913616 [Artomyces pyxidatus]|uniref:Uncharacterized protein n=1 Tax=Artomyces pyxidatus TaxID=48021 RepID=A0ACB8TAN0_9AGAM|nr:hypothetical protein BV25DRAFT_1913616 [Artomyces pyxidatus]